MHNECLHISECFTNTLPRKPERASQEGALCATCLGVMNLCYRLCVYQVSVQQPVNVYAQFGCSGQKLLGLPLALHILQQQLVVETDNVRSCAAREGYTQHERTGMSPLANRWGTAREWGQAAQSPPWQAKRDN